METCSPRPIAAADGGVRRTHEFGGRARPIESGA